MPTADNPPHQNAEAEPSWFESLRKLPAARGPWDELDRIEKILVEMAICHALLTFGRKCIDEHPDIVVHGRKLICFEVHFQYGAILFLMPANNGVTLIMADLYLDNAKLHEERNTVERH